MTIARKVAAGSYHLERMNYFSKTENLTDALWHTTGLGFTGSQTDPSGGAGAFLTKCTQTGAVAYTYFVPGVATGWLSISLRVKASGRNVLFLYMRTSGENGLAYFDLSDLSTQVVAGSVSTLVASITPLGNGWYVTAAKSDLSIAMDGSLAGAGFGISDAKGSLSVTANASNGIIVYGPEIRPSSKDALYPLYQPQA